jgi:hypothetical protein
MEEKKENVVTVNGQAMTQEQFEEKKQQINESKGSKIVEVGKNTFKTHLDD